MVKVDHRRLMQAGAVLAEPLDDLQRLRNVWSVVGNPVMVPGPSGGAINLSGSGQYLVFGNSREFSFGDGATDEPFSVACLIKMDEATTFPVIGKGVYNTNAEWRLLVHSDDKLYVQAFDESVADCYIGQASDAALTIYEGQWIHVCATYDGSGTSAGFKLYVNGQLVASSAAEMNPGSYTAMERLSHDVWIGRDGTNDADGAFCSALIVPRVLTPTEVADFCAGQPFSYMQHLVARWDMSEALGVAGSPVTFQDRCWRQLGYHLTEVSPTAAIDPVTGAVGGIAARFNGTDEYARLAAADWRGDDEEGTLACWVRRDALGVRARVFSSCDEAGAAYFMYFEIHNTRNSMQITQSNNDVNDVVYGNTVLAAGVWYHLVWVSDGSAYRFYVNGQPETLLIAGAGGNFGDWFADTANRDNVVIGASVLAAAGGFFAGAIDGALCFSRGLTPLQVADLYQMCKQGRLL